MISAVIFIYIGWYFLHDHITSSHFFSLSSYLKLVQAIVFLSFFIRLIEKIIVHILDAGITILHLVFSFSLIFVLFKVSLRGILVRKKRK